MRWLRLTVLLGLLCCALASCGREEREDGGLAPKAPSATPESAAPAVVEEETTTPYDGCAVRFRCTFPPGLDAVAEVRAWWKEVGAASSELHPVRRSGEHLIVEVPPGEGVVSIHVAGCVVVRREIEAKANAVTDAGALELKRCTVLRGRVVDEDGTPVDGASVWPKAGELSVPLTNTDEDGRFDFDGFPDGEVTLRVESDDHVRMTVVVENGPDVAEETIVLNRGGELRGIAVSPDGEPDADAYVWIVDPADEKNRDRMAWPYLEEDGTFAVHLAPGRYRVHGRSDRGTGTATVEVREGEAVQMRLILAPR